MPESPLPSIQPELYDAAYSWYHADEAFYLDAARAARGPVLEIGCGTGRHLIPALQAGVDIEGLDVDPGMLAVLRRKADALGLKLAVHQADMRDFTMRRRYALITIPFRAFMHLLTTADQLRALRCIREHLEPGGALLFNIFHPSFEALIDPHHPVHQDREVTHPETGLPLVLHVRSRELDRVNQVMRVVREIRESDPRGYAGAVHVHAFELRWTWKPEMELLLQVAGFTRWSVRGGFDGRPLERDTDEMVWTAWRD
jgi:SAM-dependent methyltransferase